MSDELVQRKRRRISGPDPEHEAVTAQTCTANPYGVQPSGNMYLADTGSSIRQGLGNLATLSDSMILEVLGLLDAQDLCALAQTSRALYIFSHHDDLWRELVIHHGAANGFRFQQCWKVTYARCFAPNHLPWLACHSHKPIDARPPLMCSDTLFQSWYCATIEIPEEWALVDPARAVPRRHNLSLADFIRDFEKPNRPVVLTGVTQHWQALNWDLESLANRCGDVHFEAGPVQISMSDYISYAKQTTEERPLYIFDPRFCEKFPELGSEYEVPEHFSEDLFSLLGAARPNHRWIIAGPARSGSTWHIDPNATSAWNAVIQGRKKWILCPPSVVPPGVFPSADGSEVTSPVSIPEWFANFYDQLPPQAVECVVEPGEVMFVPTGWWHTVLNLDESIAITQNYVSRRNLVKVLDFLENKKDQVSGCDDGDSLGKRFTEAFESAFPGEIAALRGQQHQTLWQQVTGSQAPSNANTVTSFSFGF